MTSVVPDQKRLGKCGMDGKRERLMSVSCVSNRAGQSSPCTMFQAAHITTRAKPTPPQLVDSLNSADTINPEWF